MDQVTTPVEAVKIESPLNGTTPPAVTAPVEAAPPAEAPQSEEDKRAASRFAALSKREKALRERETQLKTWEAQQAEAKRQFQVEQSKFSTIAQAVANARTKPDELLKLAGVDYDFLTRYYLNNGAPAPEDRVSALEQRLEQEKLDREARDRDAQTAAIKQQEAQIQGLIDVYRKETTNFISSNPEAYELIIAHEAYDEVFLLIAEHFQKTGVLLSPKDGAEQYEKMLEEGIEKATKLKKFQAKLAPQEVKQESTNIRQNTARSLTSSQVMSDPTREQSVSSSLTREERLRKAAERLVYKD